MPLDAKKIASMTPMVSTSPRAVPSTLLHLLGERRRHLGRPGLEQNLRDLIGEFDGAEVRRQRGDQDQEREQRHQRGQRNVAGDRPAVVGIEAKERIQCGAITEAQYMHGVLVAAAIR